jgi:RNA-directed DNA polymerase
MDKIILKKFLKAEFMEKNVIYPTISGVQQGGNISPTIMVMTLSGLEKKIKSLFNNKGHKVNFVSFADDFIITGASKELLEEQVIPVVKSFLKERGLELSQEKSKITHIEEGFNFLGFNVRKYKGKLLIKPTKANVKAFLTEIKENIKTNIAAKTENLIMLLNPKIRGWANYFRHVVSSRTFTYADKQIAEALWRWMKRRHPNKGGPWIANRYLKRKNLTNLRLHASFKDKDGKQITSFIRKTGDTPIRRHTKIRGKANPYNPEFKNYFKQRETNRLRLSKGCKAVLFAQELLGHNNSGLIRA